MALSISLYLPHMPSAPGSHSETLQHLARHMLEFTPEVALPEPNILVMGVQASLCLFGGPARLCRSIKQRIRQCLPGVAVRMAMAPSIRGAMLLCQFKGTPLLRVLSLKSLARQLAGLPLQALPAAAPFVQWLHSIGCHTLGQLNTLPRGGLQQRAHPQLLQQLDQAYGRTEAVFPWFTPAPCFRQLVHLNCTVEHAHALQELAQPVLQQACLWLDQHQLACHVMHLELHHERGRLACPPTPVRIARANAAWQLNDFLPLLAQQLHGMVLKQPVVAIGVGIQATQARHTGSNSLFPDTQEQRRLEDQVLDLIRARLGATALRAPCPVADYLPEYANAWQAYGYMSGPPSNPKPAPAETGWRTDLAENSRPAWLFNPPQPLETRNNRPVYAGRELRLVQGPERLESRWWSPAGHQQRDYFIAMSSNGIRYWVYRQRGTTNLRWFLHGQFG